MKIKPNKQIDVVVLAAGQGKRMYSDTHKVLHTIGGKPMLLRLLESIQQLKLEKQLHIVYGHRGNQIKDACNALEIDAFWTEQEQQLGTSHAVAQTLDNLNNNSVVLICYGDVPLVQTATLQKLIHKALTGALAILTVEYENPTGYGRIQRDRDGNVFGIVECKDASKQQKLIRECNTGIMAVPAIILRHLSPQIKNNNSQGEYYLTDIVQLARDEDIPIKTAQPEFDWEVCGVNNQLQLANLEGAWRAQSAEQLMDMGLRLSDPQRFDLRGEISFGKDCSIDINTIVEGRVYLGDKVKIGSHCILRNCNIGDNSVIAPFSMVDSSSIEKNVSVGPYARLRPMSHLKDNSKVGNFVEVKKSVIGLGSKVSHLSYIGDAELGSDVNVGAGTITCNYDGIHKHRTVIGDKVFIGSNTALVAPIEIGEKALVGAGTTISKSVQAGSLVVTRAEAKILPNYNK